MNPERATWTETREHVLERDDHACQFCGIDDDTHREERGRGLHVHHVIPENDGGTDHPRNLITVCGGCHRTIEEAHAKAVAGMKRREDYADDLDGIDHVWRKYWGVFDDFNDDLAEWIDGHPVFADRFAVGVGRDGNVESGSFTSAAAGGDCEIQSEWDFAVAWGYKEGVLDVLAALDGWSDVPFDEDDGESD